MDSKWKGFMASSVFLALFIGGWYLNGKVENNKLSEDGSVEIQQFQQRTEFLPREYIKISDREFYKLNSEDEKTANEE